MDSRIIFLWVIFSVVLGILFYKFLVFEDAIHAKMKWGLSTISGVLKRLPSRIIFMIIMFISIFQYNPSNQQGEDPVNSNLEPQRRREWFEWLAIIAPTWVYCLPFLDLGSSTSLPGPESEYFQSFDQILEFAIKRHGQFPLWNSYFFTGIPYVAHPMLHTYNPFVSIPVLLFGTMDGFKVAVFLGFMIAGLGMWWLGKEIGLSRIGCIWVGLMYAFCGVPAAKFIQGHYLMVLAFGWIPFSLAAILAATSRKRGKYVCMAAIGLALLFFSGNVYYAYYMLYVIGLYAVIQVFKFKRKPIKLKVDRGNIKVLSAIGILALGLIAIQLLPLFDYRDRYIKPINMELSDSQDITNIVLDFVSPEPFRPGAFSSQLRPEEFYAYIGWWPFIGMLFLPFAWGIKDKRYILFFVGLIIFTFLWIDVKEMPWRSVFQAVPFLYQFRYPSRMIIVGVMALIAAGGLGMDSLWNGIKKFIHGSKPGNFFAHLAGYLFALAIGVFLIWSVYDLGSTSRPLLQTIHQEPPEREAMQWLRKFDPEVYYYANNLQDGRSHKAGIENEARYLNVWDSISIVPDNNDQISARRIKAEPKYWILANNATAPKNGILIKTFDTIRVYKMTNSLPFAFTISESTLTTESDANLDASEVSPVTSFTTNINSIEGIVNSDTKKALVVLSTFSSGWQLNIDDKPTKIYNAYGYMAADVNPGSHHYMFIYQPGWFFVGLTISLLTLFAITAMLIADRQQRRNGRFERLEQINSRTKRADGKEQRDEQDDPDHEQDFKQTL